MPRSQTHQHDHNMTDSLSKKQFGFKRGTSTETALHKIAHTIERRIAKKGYVLGTFIGIEGAFDNVSFKAISDAINSSPVDKSTAGWIINMVKYRHLTVTQKDITKRIRIRRGCPQGGILSSFLWNLVVDDLLKFSAKEIPGYLQAFTTTNNSPHNIINYSSFKLPDFCSVFQAEVTAIKEVITTLQHNRSKTIVIWTDSLSTLQALSSKLTRNKTVNHCHEALDELAKRNTVHIKWIAAHVGHWGNERADEIAKIGTTNTSLVKGYIPQSHIKALINHKAHLLNQVEWTKNGHCHTNTMLGNKHNREVQKIEILSNFCYLRLICCS